jgi:hypothetical protein
VGIGFLHWGSEEEQQIGEVKKNSKSLAKMGEAGAPP